MCRRDAAGFTLTEVLLVVAVIAILAVLSAATFQNLNNRSSLDSSVQSVKTALLNARDQTLASNGDTVYGVHISTTTVVTFSGPSYNPTAPSNVSADFLGGVTATRSLSGGTQDVVFERLTGYANATGTITLVSGRKDASSTITVHASGLIE